MAHLVKKWYTQELERYLRTLEAMANKNLYDEPYDLYLLRIQHEQMEYAHACRTLHLARMWEDAHRHDDWMWDNTALQVRALDLCQDGDDPESRRLFFWFKYRDYGMPFNMCDMKHQHVCEDVKKALLEWCRIRAKRDAHVSGTRFYRAVVWATCHKIKIHSLKEV